MHTTARHTFHHQTIAVPIQPGIDAESCLGCLLWFVSEACQTPTSARVAFKWLHIHLANTQLAVIHHTTG